MLTASLSRAERRQISQDDWSAPNVCGGGQSHHDFSYKLSDLHKVFEWHEKQRGKRNGALA